MKVQSWHVWLARYPGPSGPCIRNTHEPIIPLHKMLFAESLLEAIRLLANCLVNAPAPDSADYDKKLAGPTARSFSALRKPRAQTELVFSTLQFGRVHVSYRALQIGLWGGPFRELMRAGYVRAGRCWNSCARLARCWRKVGARLARAPAGWRRRAPAGACWRSPWATMADGGPH